MKKKRILSILLALAMILTFMPAIAFAEVPAGGTAVAKNVGTGEEYVSLRAAIDDAASGATIKLLADDTNNSLTDTSGGIIIAEKNLTIDGNGFTLSGASFINIPNVPNPASISDDNVNGFYIKGSSNVTIKDLNITKIGDKSYVNKFGMVPILTSTAYSGTLKLENVNIDKFDRQAICIFGGSFEITGGTINGNAENKEVSTGNDHFQQGIEIRGGSGTIKDVKVRGMDSNLGYPGIGIVSWSNNVVLEDVDVDVKGIGVEPDGCTITIKGENTTVKGTEKAVFVEDAGCLNIEGGIYSGEIAIDTKEGSAISITEGAFDSDTHAQFVAADAAPKAEVKRGSDTLYVIGKADYAIKDGDKVTVKKAKTEGHGDRFYTDKNVAVTNGTGEDLFVNGTLIKNGGTINSKEATDISDKADKCMETKDAYEAARQSGDDDKALEAAKAYKAAADALKSAIDKQEDVVAEWKVGAEQEAENAANELVAAQNAVNNTAKKSTAATAAAQEAALQGVLDTNLPNVKAKRVAKVKKTNVTAKWKKVSKKNKKKIDGVEIWVSADPSFTTGRIIKTAGKAKVSKKVSGLASKTTYYVKVRSYKNVGGNKHVGNWSKVKKVTTK